ncbi:hypothetical protein [Stutzerimonas stutzeri]|uniref:hypothetical protein n=1 Tax=Stutzerimonas stutzeri TaxID=316 RepID=UPI0015E3E2DC|nr:hypothetical protein [Stutzerimonas stutzeri]MBA1280288.1 hypothetical protein [Stutzerimonas stutzeri]
MSRTTHAIAYRDRQYLWRFSPARDMTGAYVDQQDLERLLEKPTKTMAVRCLENQIEYWFQAGTEDGGKTQVAELLQTDAEVRAIYERHIGTLPDDEL